MGNPISLSAYGAVQALADRALESAKGIRVQCSTRVEANKIRNNFYAFRHRVRKLNARMGGGFEDPTPYDALVLLIEPAPVGFHACFYKHEHLISNLQVTEIE